MSLVSATALPRVEDAERVIAELLDQVHPRWRQQPVAYGPVGAAVAFLGGERPPPREADAELRTAAGLSILDLERVPGSLAHAAAERLRVAIARAAPAAVDEETIARTGGSE